ncbi:universal stress protein [Deinococcus sp. SDU3-2]|uniref:Universal stress protein n=1 Tax=Deinococcus terrestris TaxID=2651870 RepID=A0A7X1TSC1_9DEIO|nr:universal stress protein [Deinococcus terrestris]MPY67660.1 universal stress protein [Deinococcus terrestris]
MTRVLVLMDFSAAALGALRVARAAFPEQSPAVLHVVPSLPVGRVTGTADVPDVGAHPEWYAQERGALAALGGGELALGHPAGEALRRARAGECDVLALGTAGRRGLSRLLLGSVAEEVIRESPVPVLSVHSPDPGDHQPLPVLSRRRWLRALRDLEQEADAPVPRVLVLMDFSPAARQALAFVQTHLPGAETEVLHVVDPASLVVPFPLPDVPAPPLRGVSSAMLEERNAAWEQEARARVAELGGGEVVRGDPAQIALDRAASGEYDLLAVGTSSKGGLSRLMLGSVALRIVRESPIPVLTARDLAEPQPDI